MRVAACPDLDQGKIWGITGSVHYVKGGQCIHRVGCPTAGMTAQGQKGDAKVLRVEEVLLAGVAPGHFTVKPQP